MINGHSNGNIGNWQIS